MKALFPFTLAVLILGIFMPSPSHAQAGPAVSYHASWPEPHSHYFHLRMEITAPGDVVDVRLPAWRPGRYIMQDFAKNIIGFEATDATGTPLAFRKTDKSTWRVQTDGANKVVVRYKSYAHELDAGNSYLDETEAYLNPITLLMYIPGHELDPVTLSLDKPAHWKVATALDYDEARGVYPSETYHDLVDSPFIVSPDFEVLSFEEGGATFELVFQGEGNYDAEKVIRDVQAIAKAQINIMQVVPFERYVFLYHLMPTPMGHGVEHKNSTSIVMGPADFNNLRFYNGLMGVTAHELFHAWNVERIRPEVLYHPDYSKEAYTTSMWIYEGITSYYTTVSMVRSGFINETQMLQRMAGTLRSYDNTPGRQVTSVAMTSWDSWIKSSNAPPHTFYSFYTAGNVLGLLLDLEVRGRTNNEKSLDDVFRYLYDTYPEQDRGVPEDGMEQALETLTGTSFQPFFDAYVYGTEPIDYNAFLRHAGLVLEKTEDPNQPAVSLGIEFERGADEASVNSILPASATYEAGLNQGDMLVAIDGHQITLDGLTSLLKSYAPGDTVMLSYFRGDKLRTATVTLQSNPNRRYTLKPLPDSTDLQKKIREDWVGP